MVWRAWARFFATLGAKPGNCSSWSGSSPHNPPGGDCSTPPISPLPWATMSTNAWRSMLSDIARRSSGLLNGGLSRLMIRWRFTVPGAVADRIRQLAHDVLYHRRREPAGDIEFAGGERQYRGRRVADDCEVDGVEVGPVRFPIIRIAHQLDVFVGFELDKFERPGADRALAHLVR